MNEVETVKQPQEYLTPEQTQEITKELQEITQKAQSLRVVNEESLAESQALCHKATQRKKGIEKFRLAIVGPFNSHIATINAFFKNQAGKFDEPVGILEDKNLKYRERKIEAERKERERLEREAREKEAKIKAELEEKAKKANSEAEAERLRKQAAETKVEVKEPTKVVPAKTTFQEGVGKITYVKDADHVIENKDLIPDEFWIVDEKLLGARVRELRSTLEVGKTYRDLIPGVAITSVERPSYTKERASW